MTTHMLNDTEARFHGLRRSGNHAVISWVRWARRGISVHCNNIYDTDLDPFKACEQIETRGVPYLTCRKSWIGAVWHAVKRARDREAPIIVSRYDPRALPENIRALPRKDLLVLSYENRRLDEVCVDEFERRHDEFVGKSLHRYDVLVLRDPYNLFASMLKSGRLNGKNRTFILETWKQHAREFVGETHFMRWEPVCVNYNQWVVSGEYRSEILKKLGLPANEDRYEFVTEYGGGSSFDGIRSRDNASEMRTLERWKEYVDDSFFRELFHDEELLDISKRLFGDVASLRDFRLPS